MAVSILLLAAPSCAPHGARPPLFSGSPVITVRMTDYAFELPADIPAGRVVFRVENAGSLYHNVSVFGMGPEWLPLDEQLHSATRKSVNPFAQVFAMQPGEHGTFAANFRKGGRYGFICELASPDGRPHYLLGMNAEIRPGGGT